MSSEKKKREKEIKKEEGTQIDFNIQPISQIFTEETDNKDDMEDLFMKIYLRGPCQASHETPDIYC